MADTLVTNPTATPLGLYDVGGAYQVAGGLGGQAIVDPDFATQSVLGVWGVTQSTPAAPVNTVAPVASGADLTEGQEVECTAGTWTGNPAPTITYQWQEDGGTATWVDIDGATSATLVLPAAAVGSDVRCVVTATSLAGTDSENSNELGPVLG